MTSRLWARLESRPVAADPALAAAALGIAVITSGPAIKVFEFSDPTYRAPSAVLVLAGLAMVIAPLAVRRRFPLAAAVASTAGYVVARVLLDQAENAVVPIAVSFAIFSAAAHGRPRWRNLVCGMCLVAVMGELWWEIDKFIPAGFPDRRIYQAI